MAFNRPIEADEVSGDDLDLLSFFFRAPILGTLMWFLGGSEAINDADHHKSEKAKPERELICEKIVSPEIYGKESIKDEVITNVSKDVPPCMNEEIPSLRKSRKASALLNEAPSSPTLRNRSVKRQSWSDESGQSLVENFYNTQSPLHEPSKASLSPKSLKSAIRRNSFGRNRGFNSQGNIPKIPTSDGLIMHNCSRTEAKRNGGISPISNGHNSPQWGWYIYTTPPQHELYSSGVEGSKTNTRNPASQPIYDYQYRSNTQHIHHTPMISDRQYQKAGYTHPGYDTGKIVFTKNVKGVGHKANMGWPSVPL